MSHSSKWPLRGQKNCTLLFRDGTNRKEPENAYYLLVAATLEKAITYVFAESPIRNAEVRDSRITCDPV